MKQDKNIDQLFQEKLKNLDVKPSEKVWAGIEAELNKKKTRVLPFWWYASGIAAALILGFLLFPFSEVNNVENNNQNIEIITSSPKNKTNEKIDKKTDFKSPILNKNKKEEVIVTIEKPVVKNKKSTINKETFVAENSNSYKDKELKNIPEKDSTLDSKNAMKKIFTSKRAQDSINKKVEEKRDILKPKKDFLATVTEKDSLKIDVLSPKKWSVSPSFALLNSNSFSKNSSLDTNLNTNTTTGENTYSYGVKVAYEINKKWTIQSGIHLQEMGFSTKDVRISATLSKQSLANVNAQSQLKFNSSPVFQSVEVTNPELLVSNEQGELNQRFGYIEIPLEIKYRLTNLNRFKTEIVTGFSSLFLNKNSVNLSSESFTGTIGEANNLNNINFSGNLGFDFNYAVDKNLFLNLNPMFKVQLNTFSENSNGFQPYFFGVYTGIKYQF